MKLGKSYAVALSGDGAYLATCSGGKVYVWTLASCAGVKDAKSVKVKDPSDLVFTPDSKSLLVKTTSGVLGVIDVHSSLTLRKVRGPCGEGARPGFSGSGDRIVDGSWNGVTSVVCSETGTVTWEKKCFFEIITHVLWSADYQTWLFLHSPQATLANAPPQPCYFSQWDYPFGDHPIRTIEPGLRMVRAAALTPDAKRVAILYGAPPTNLAIIDLFDGSIRNEIITDTGGTGTFLSWSPNGRVLGSVERDRVAFYAEDLSHLGHTSLAYPCCIAFAKDSSMIALGSWSNGCLLGESEALEVTRGRLTTV